MYNPAVKVRYWIASAMCFTAIVGAASRSALVRATFRNPVVKARALSPCCCMARSSRRSASLFNSQWMRICCVVICAFENTARLAPRVVPLVRAPASREASVLPLPSSQDASADFFRTFRRGSASQFLVLYRRDLDMNVDAVEQRPAYLRDIPLNVIGGVHTQSRLLSLW